MALGAGPLELLDPTAEREASVRPLAPRLTPGTGSRVALLDIRKPRGDVFLDELAAGLTQRGYEVVRTSKPTFTKPAPADVRREISEQCEAVIEALAD
jgi:hypothetical protein